MYLRMTEGHNKVIKENDELKFWNDDSLLSSKKSFFLMGGWWE